MPQQPEVTTIGPDTGVAPIVETISAPPMTAKPATGAAKGDASGSGHGQQRIPRWLERSELFLRVLIRMYIGIAVCCAPWTPFFWDHNPLFAQFPTLSIYAANGAVRGIISGLGLLNLWIAFRDAVRHRDE